VQTWGLNRPDTRNTVSDADAIEAIEQAVNNVNRDPTMRVVILTGAGSAFSSGGNIKHMHETAGMFGGTPAHQRHGNRHGIQRIPRAFYQCEIPTITAVNRPAKPDFGRVSVHHLPGESIFAGVS
jgi:enoyl-CoA hydratase/carnithine racemase